MSYPPLPPVRFSCKWGEHEIEGDVVNPGDNWGEGYVIEIGCGYSSLYFYVEADGECEAIDEFADSKYGHLIEISEEDMADYDEDGVSRAGNDGHPVDLDNLLIHDLPNVVYKAPFLMSSGVTPEEYHALQSADKLDRVWGPELPIEPDNSFRYVDIRYPIELPGIRDIGSYVNKHVHYGDFVKWGDGQIGRAFGIHTNPVLNDDKGMMLCVMEWGFSLSHCYLRTVPVSEITGVASASQFTRWFFGSSFGDSQTVLSYSRHGSLSNNYIGQYLENGELRPVKPPFHYAAITANCR